MGDVTEAVSTPPPETGVADLDEALAEVDLRGPVAEHPQQLATAVEVLQQLLRNPSRS